MKRQKMLKELIEWFSSHEQARLDVEKFIGCDDRDLLNLYNSTIVEEDELGGYVLVEFNKNDTHNLTQFANDFMLMQSICSIINQMIELGHFTIEEIISIIVGNFGGVTIDLDDEDFNEEPNEQSHLLD